MTIRTISMLPELTVFKNNDLLEVSQAHSDSYISKKSQIGVLTNHVADAVSSLMTNEFQLTDIQGVPLNVRAMSEVLSAVYDKDIQLSGTKTFTAVPKISAPLTAFQSVGDSAIPNESRVREIIAQDACFVSNASIVQCDPGNDQVPSYVKSSKNMMTWHIDDGGFDTTEWMDPEMNNQKTQSAGVVCKYTGWLTIYGWLADNGSVLPQDCWVGLYGNTAAQSDSGKINNCWTLLQLQPWIKGSNASNLQYVGFNIPVRAGLRIKIKTGFPVNGHVGGFQHGRSLTYALNQPNTFVGYVTRSEHYEL